MVTLLLVTGAAALFFALERAWPATRLEPARYWYPRAALFNACQALIAFAGAFTWDLLMAPLWLFPLRVWPLPLQIVCGYLAITFIYYWWHRARHSIPSLWRHLHQLHHSPARIEVITSFYKHPLEILLNGILSSAILYLLLGLSAPAVACCVTLTGLAELVYHSNLKTPRIMGVFFQRPEMHRIHHQRGRHHYNYSDLPLWDMLFGTYRNPASTGIRTGFPEHNENRLWALLRGQELRS